jgi:glycosyltransferase
LKVSIVTVVRNNENSILDAIECIKKQSYEDIEHIVVDGESTDSTWEVINNNYSEKMLLIREPDDGIYDALNKGINHASGDIIGILHSDDLFADQFVIQNVVDEFKKNKPDFIYGDLIYITQKSPHRVIRKWIAGEFKKKKLRYGWMPPHPTIFLKSEVYSQIGGYDRKYKISADYKFILQLFLRSNLSWGYIPRVLVKMRMGGLSTKNFSSIISKTKEDLLALNETKVGGFLTVFYKNTRKLMQFF